MLLEANEVWQTQHRYMQTEPMAELIRTIINAEATKITTQAA